MLEAMGIAPPTQQQRHEDPTTTMKANTPGTKEFQERHNAIINLIHSKNARNRHRLPSLSGPTDQQTINNNNNFMMIHPSRPSFLARQVEKIPVVGKRSIRRTPEQELIFDATLSFLESLQYGVFHKTDTAAAGSAALSKDRIEALKDWLELLRVTLPPEWALHTIIDTLLVNVPNIATSRSHLDNILQQHPLMTTKRGTRGTTPMTSSRSTSIWSPSCGGKRGFSCGMWKLMHIMSLGLAEQRGGQYLNMMAEQQQEDGRPTTTTNNLRIFSPSQAAHVLRNFIDKTFACDVCRETFLKLYNEPCHHHDTTSHRYCVVSLSNETTTTNVESWKEFALWVWQIHNDVRIYVTKHEMERKALQTKFAPLPQQQAEQSSSKQQEHQQQKNLNIVAKSLYPTIGQCIACFQEDGSWNEAAVFVYLEHVYWSGSTNDVLLLTQRTMSDADYQRLQWMLVFAGLLLPCVYRTTTKRNHINRSAGGQLQRSWVAASAVTNKISVSIRGTKEKA